MNFNKLLSYFGIPYIIYKNHSKYNGEILVTSVFGQSSISVGNLTQTGSIVEGLWKTALKRFMIYDLRFRKILVLGVGGGSIISILRKKFPDVEITGVEIDKTMIDIGNKYFDLEKYNAKIIIKDAFGFVKKNQKKYNLICIDLLIGRKAPTKLSSVRFFKNIKRILNNDGVVIINQLRLKNQPENKNLLKTLKKVFTNIEIKKPLVNTLIYCMVGV